MWIHSNGRHHGGLAVPIALGLLLTAACSSGDSTGGMMSPGPTSQSTIQWIQNNIFTPKCAVSGCHAGATPQPIQGAGMDLTMGQAQASLIGVTSTIDPQFERVKDGDPVNSYLYMKVIGDPRIEIAIPGLCSLSTDTLCATDGDCPATQTCVTTGQRMPKNAPPLSASELNAIRQWIASRGPGDPPDPGY